VPNFSYATLADAQAALAARLYESLSDSTQEQWPADELTVYIVEALRSWNALTSFWRAEFPFTLTQGVNWYDLTALPSSLRPLTVTDQYLANTLEYHLLEPLTSLTPTTLNPAVWAGSGQFSLFDIYGAITRRQNDTLGASGCTITRSVVSAPVVRTGIILSDSTIDIRRVAWFPASGQGWDTQILRQTDAWAKRAFDYLYLSSPEQAPTTWLQSTEPPPRFDVDYVPPVPGQYEVLTVNAGPTANATSAQIVPVPNDWTWVVKWGALADLLGRESNAKDPLRADYCLKRYQEGMILMSMSPAVLAMQMNGAPLNIDAVKNGDNFNPAWQSSTQSAPQSCYSAGLNLIGFATPDAGPYGVLVTVVQNAPVPVLQGDYIQVPRNAYDAVLDEAQHLAAFKLGGTEFTSTYPLHRNFMTRCGLYNAKLKVMGQFQGSEYGLSRRESERNLRVARNG
jgi:hypothetical protein